MYANNRVAAIIVAAGEGRRMKAGMPKQFMELGGRPVLAWTAEAFEKAASVDDVYIVADAAWIPHCAGILGLGASRPVGEAAPAGAVCAEAGAGAGAGALAGAVAAPGAADGALAAADSALAGADTGACAAGQPRFAKIRKIVPGGSTRQGSVRAGLESLAADVGIVLIHDAARPFVSAGVLENIVKNAATDGASITAVALTDTIKSAAGGRISGTLDRSGLYAAQTPQAFRRGLIAAAHEKARAEGYEGTDDAMLVERMGGHVSLTEGEYSNIKLTTPEDFAIGEAIAAGRRRAEAGGMGEAPCGAVIGGLGEAAGLAVPGGPGEAPCGAAIGGAGEAAGAGVPGGQGEALSGAAIGGPGEAAGLAVPGGMGEAPALRVGTGFDVHRFAAGRRLVLCGLEIPHPEGLDGHSDADVPTHALIDAMLGAAAMGDIGKMFPDTDEAYRGISSLKLLAEAAAAIKKAGYELANADITLVMEKPKIAPFTEKMAENLAAAIGADRRLISVKATTTERLGFTGRGEGIAAQAAVLLRAARQ